MSKKPKVNGKLTINNIDYVFKDKTLNEAVSILKSFKRSFYDNEK